MNIAACQQVVEGVGNGVAASLRAVDCAASTTAQQAFARLFGSEGALMPALTILLSIYVALFAFALITGRTRMGVAALTPRMVTLGLVLTFATSWLAYQSVVWNIVVGGPDQIAGILTGSRGSATQVFADKIDVVLAALIQATGGEQGAEAATSTFSPKGLLWLGATLLLLGTVGVLATCKIALAVLLALGPVFVVMALFRGTRGLFAGWLKGLVMLALAPLFAVLSGSLMLELMVPVLSSLAQIPGQIAPQAAMAFFMIGAVHCALMFLVLKVAGAMVSGWSVFGLSAPAGADQGRAVSGPAPLALPSPAQAQVETQRATAAAGSRAREIRTASALIPANDRDNATAGGSRRETRFVTDGGNSAGSIPAAPSRTRGIGNRFRPARSTEKLK